jgi:hypothetical protein
VDSAGSSTVGGGSGGRVERRVDWNSASEIEFGVTRESLEAEARFWYRFSIVHEIFKAGLNIFYARAQKALPKAFNRAVKRSSLQHVMAEILIVVQQFTTQCGRRYRTIC